MLLRIIVGVLCGEALAFLFCLLITEGDVEDAGSEWLALNIVIVAFGVLLGLVMGVVYAFTGGIN